MLMDQPRNVTAILDWCRAHRPDLVATMTAVIEQGNHGLILMMTTCFEAGRLFQATAVEDPTRYAPMEEVY